MRPSLSATGPRTDCASSDAGEAIGRGEPRAADGEQGFPRYNGGPKPFEFVRRPNDSSDVDPNRIYPKAAPIKLSAHPNYEHFSGRNCIGGGGSGRLVCLTNGR